LTSLDISDNILCGLYSDGSGTFNGAGVAALSDLLKVNSVLKELMMSRTYIGSEGAKVLSLGLSGNGALTSLDVSSNNLGCVVGWTYHPANGRSHKHKHSDGRNQELLPEGEELGKPEGAIALANAISDMGALFKLDITDNDIPADLMQTMQQVATLHRAAKHEMEAAVQGVSQEMKKVDMRAKASRFSL
jgi:hypothetical protein